MQKFGFRHIPKTGLFAAAAVAAVLFGGCGEDRGSNSLSHLFFRYRALASSRAASSSKGSLMISGISLLVCLDTQPFSPTTTGGWPSSP